LPFRARVKGFTFQPLAQVDDGDRTRDDKIHNLTASQKPPFSKSLSRKELHLFSFSSIIRSCYF
jgi:hypothetical protein